MLQFRYITKHLAGEAPYVAEAPYAPVTKYHPIEPMIASIIGDDYLNHRR